MEKEYSFSFKLSDINFNNINELKYILSEYRRLGIRYVDLIVDEKGIHKIFRRKFVRMLRRLFQDLELDVMITLDLNLDFSSAILESRVGSLLAYDEILKRILILDPVAIIIKLEFGTYPWEDTELYYLKKETLLNSLSEIKLITEPVFLGIEPKRYNYFELQILSDIADLLGLGFAVRKDTDPEFIYKAFYVRDKVGELRIPVLESIRL